MDELERPAKAAFGRQLSDLWLDGEEGKLHPAEMKLLECAARGEACALGHKRPAYPTDANRIRAELLRFIILGGDYENPLHEAGVILIGAWVECESERLDLEGCDVPENVNIFRFTIHIRNSLRSVLKNAH